MGDEDKSKEQLIVELKVLRSQLAKIEHRVGIEGYASWLEEIVTQCAHEAQMAQAKLAQSEARLRSFMDAATDGFLLLDSELNIVEANPTLLKIAKDWMGLDKEEINGKNLSALVPEPTTLIKFRTVIKTGKPLFIDDPALPPQFRDKHVVLRVFKVGEGLGIIATDITKRKKAENKFRESEEKLHSIVQTANDAIITINSQKVIVSWNNAAETMFGYLADEIIGKPITLVIPERFHTTHQEEMNQLVVIGKSHTLRLPIEVVCLRKGGYEFPVELSLTTWRAGKDVFFTSIVRDITARKQAELVLLESERRYRSLFEDAPISLWELDYSIVKQHIDRLRDKGVTDFHSYFELYPETMVQLIELIKVNDVNKATLELYDIGSIEELSGLSQNYTKGNYQTFREGLIAFTEGKTVFESESTIETLTGDKKNSSIRLSMVTGVEATWEKVLISIFDITERKRIEAALQVSEDQYRSLFEDAPISLWEEDYSAVKKYIDQLRCEGITDFRTFFATNPEVVHQCLALVKVINVNNATLELYDVKNKDDLLSEPSRHIFTQDAHEKYKESLIALAEGYTMFNTESIRRKQSGDLIHVSSKVSLAPGCNENWKKVFISSFDITEQKRAEEWLQKAHNELEMRIEERTATLNTTNEQLRHEIISRSQVEAALQESEAKYSTLVEKAHDGVVIVQDGIFQFANQATGQISGYNSDELLKMPFLDLVMPEFKDLVRHRYQTHQAIEKIPNIYDIQIQSKDGTIKDVEISDGVIQYQGLPATMAIIRDVTIRKKAK